MASGGLKLGVGLSLGLSLGALANPNIINRIFPKPEPPPAQPATSALDAKLVEQLISHDRKVNQLESQLSLLRQDLRERQQQAEAQATASQTPTRANGNVFELSQVIQANNLANSAKYERDIEEQRRTLVREHLLKVEGEILKVENKYRPIVNKIKELESHLEAQRQAMQKERPARLLWISCQSLLEKLTNGPQEPLSKDPAYTLLKRLAAENDPTAISILDSIPAVAIKEGIPSEQSLSTRFNKIERVCKRVALVGAQGGGLTNYILSYLQSLMIFDNVKVPEEEIQGNKLVDPAKWTTFDILARVRYCLTHNDLEQAVRYANQLRGQARVVAKDWIRDARVHLTTRQAFSTLSTFYSYQPDLNNNMATWPK